jgi:predicted DNA helicase
VKIKFENIFEYILYFKKLIEFEREEQTKLHKKEILNISGKEREKRKRAILNLKGKYIGKGIGNTYLVKLFKEKDAENKNITPTNISIGDLVIITYHKKPNFKEQQAVVKQITKDYIIVSYSERPAQYIFQKNNLRLDLFTNEITFQRMLDALTILKNRPDLQKILLGKLKFPKEENKTKIKIIENNLNDSQNLAIINSIKHKYFSIIHGPFGCGKTTTLVEIVKNQIDKNNKILICADSNIAIDNIVEKLANTNLDNFIRIGNPSRLDENIYKYSLDYKVENDILFKDLKSLKDEVEKLKELQENLGVKPTPELKRGLSDSQIKKYANLRKSTRGVPAPLIRKMDKWIHFQKNIKQINSKIKIVENEIINKILDKTKIIITTNVSSRSEILENYYNQKRFKFDLLIIDEATQATEPSCLIPMTCARKYILAGDHKQLPPTVMSEKAKNLSLSLFERLIKLYNSKNLTLLDTQYRMNEELADFSNKNFYESKIKTGEKNKNISLNDFKTFQRNFKKINNKKIRKILDAENYSVFINTENNKEYQKEHSTSYENKIEVEIIKNIIYELKKIEFPLKEVGIITPYDNQVELLNKTFENEKELEIKSIDGFQGREKEIIIISLVRSNEQGKIGFLKDYRRLNVAITRQKRKRIIIGNFNTLKNNKVYNKLVSESIFIKN